MTMLGKNITAAADPLLRVEILDLYKMIKEPSADLISKIRQLRTIQSIDPNRYRQMKTMLPYITCGIFNPATRKTENFAAISYFIIDIDHLNDKGLTTQDLKNKMVNDNRVLMMFVSPGNQGLKIMFRLNDKCYDRTRFSMFYKLFAQSFSSQYGLNQVIDLRTSDVTRACFLSIDEDCYYNDNALVVSIEAYIDFDSILHLKEANQMISKFETQTNENIVAEPINEISPEILFEIRQKLNPKTRLKKEKLIYVPEELETIIEKIKENVQEFKIVVKEIININYGKKFVFAVDNFWAELNVFYGKRGFSVVKSPKSGSNAELCDIVNTILVNCLFNYKDAQEKTDTTDPF